MTHISKADKKMLADFFAKWQVGNAPDIDIAAILGAHGYDREQITRAIVTARHKAFIAHYGA